MKSARVRRIHPRWGRSGLALIELLICMVLVGLLALLSAAAATQVRSRARAVCCFGNLREWSLAGQLYALDENDFLPPEGAPNGLSRHSAWYVTLPERMAIEKYHEAEWRTNRAASIPRSIWLCPQNTNRSNGRLLFHYCLNGKLDGTGDQDRPARLSSFGKPSQSVWLFDNGRRAGVAQQNNVHTNLHIRGAHILFLDGHAARFPASAYWDFQRNRGLTNSSDLKWTP